MEALANLMYTMNIPISFIPCRISQGDVLLRVVCSVQHVLMFRCHKEAELSLL